MKKLNTNFALLIVQLLPPHKRQPVRIKWLQTLFNLESLYNGFTGWRQSQRRLLNINSQIKRLEGYLRTLYHPQIGIKTKTDQLTGVSLLDEGQLLPVSLYPDEQPANVPLLGELSAEVGEADFLVIVPQGVSLEALSITIEQFKLIDKTYKIKTI